MTPSPEGLSSSFRDPSGFVFRSEGQLYRQINQVYKAHYDHLKSSGLLEALVRDELLIAHEEVSEEVGGDVSAESAAYKVIKPQLVRWISYPYEWCFSQLKAAALTTLAAQKKALEHGMTLKDATAYNVQFHRGRPILIDTLSFERYEPGKPWAAYRQFCEHFLAPLSLMSRRDARLGQLLRVFLDGVPLDLASKLLPFWSRLNLGLLLHVHLHGKSQRHFSNRTPSARPARRMSLLAMRGLIDSLEGAVGGLRWRPAGTVWADYYEDTNYSRQALEEKARLVGAILDRIRPATVTDLGANRGAFSRLASQRGIFTISADLDPAAVEKNHLACLEAGERNILPLCLDLTNPSPAIGWANDERMSWLERQPVDTVLALALIHHLAIASNLPLSRLARFFATICRHLVIEFVPKSDSQVKRLLASREDIFPDYTREGFERAFGKHFRVVEAQGIAGTDRTLYHLESMAPRASS